MIWKKSITAIGRRLSGITFIECAILFTLMVFATNARPSIAARPNVLILFSDDQGSADLSCYGCRDIPTPNIDSLATNGVRCTSGYVSSCMCSPSRAGLITGRSQSRFGHEINWEGRDETGVRGLPVTEKTLGNYLQSAGYRTGCVGKWHLGDVEKYHPTKRGFDEYFGHIGGSHDYFASKKEGKGGQYALEGWDGKPFEFVNDYLTDINGRAAAEFIGRHRTEPWFLYVAFNAPHGPLQATQRYLDRFSSIADEKRRTYAAMVSALDDAVGQILGELRKHAIEAKQLIDQTPALALSSDRSRKVLYLTQSTLQHSRIVGHTSKIRHRAKYP